MEKNKSFEIKVEPTDEQVLRVVLLIERTNQPNQEKYEIIKPVADKLNFYCDMQSVRCIDDCSFLAIKIKKIKFVHYDKDSEMFMMRMKNSMDLHVLDIKNREHTIYVFSEKHNFIVGYFINVRNRFRLLCLKCRMRIQFYLYACKQIYFSNQKQDSDKCK